MSMLGRSLGLEPFTTNVPCTFSIELFVPTKGKPLDLSKAKHRMAWAKFEAERELVAFLERKAYTPLPISNLLVEEN